MNDLFDVVGSSSMLGGGKATKARGNGATNKPGGAGDGGAGAAARSGHNDVDSVPLGVVGRVVRALACAALVAAQLSGSFSVMDQRDNDHFIRYARSILETQPRDAIVIVGFDQTWTSTRYLQRCEGVRPDVTLLHASMMAFEWFYDQRNATPGVVFPSTHLVGENTPGHKRGEGFTLVQFIDANIDHRPVCVAGNTKFNAWKDLFGDVPMGLYRMLHRGKLPRGPDVRRFFDTMIASWVKVDQLVRPFPDEAKYDEEVSAFAHARHIACVTSTGWFEVSHSHPATCA